ncbi:hypothetical protein AOR13_3937 [Alteromonas stellipolaris LMG 21856]|nr:hypothetical protein AOR13_3937 [Alteromonas stellipolaris LMG 21856]
MKVGNDIIDRNGFTYGSYWHIAAFIFILMYKQNIALPIII